MDILEIVAIEIPCSACGGPVEAVKDEFTAGTE